MIMLPKIANLQRKLKRQKEFLFDRYYVGEATIVQRAEYPLLHGAPHSPDLEFKGHCSVVMSKREKRDLIQSILPAFP